jgi:hypothetical protein
LPRCVGKQCAICSYWARVIAIPELYLSLED